MQPPLLWFHLTLTVVTDSTSQYCTSQHCVSHFVHYWLRTLTQSYCTEKYHSRGWRDTPQRLTSPSPRSPLSVFVTMTNTSAAASPATAAASTMPAATSGPLVRPSRCTITQGTTHCTCEPGYTISGRDSNTCTGTCHPVPDTDVNTHIWSHAFIKDVICVCVAPFRYWWMWAVPQWPGWETVLTRLCQHPWWLPVYLSCRIQRDPRWAQL